MCTTVVAAGGRIDAIYHCPHDGGCECRKPAPGLLLSASHDFPDIRLEESALIGDRVHDMEAAAAVGAMRIYLRGFDEPEPEADHVADDLLGAAVWLSSVFADKRTSA